MPNTEPKEETNEKEKKAESKKMEAKKAQPKIKSQLAPEETHPLFNFDNEIKTRGIKLGDYGPILLEALNQVPEEWWQAKIEDLTPLEFRVKEAMGNPELREKLQDMLISEGVGQFNQ